MPAIDRNRDDENSSQLETAWASLTDGLKEIYKDFSSNTKVQIPPKRYMELYTTVFNFCTKQNEEPPDLNIQNGRRTTRIRHRDESQQQELGGGDLYERLKDFLSSIAKDLLERCRQLIGEELLEQYTKLWNNFQFSSTVTNGIFAYLNRHFIKREIEAGKDGYFEVYNTAVNIWKGVVFEALNKNLTTAMLNLIQQERNGEKILNRLISGTISSYLELGITETPSSINRNEPIPRVDRDNIEQIKNQELKLSIYKKCFEERFISETKLYYKAESTNFVQNNSVVAYMKKVENRLLEERNRCDLYLDKSTQAPLAKACEDVLIKDHIELLHNEFEALLNHQANEDLGRVYDLCQRVDGALEDLKKIFEQFSQKEGRAAIQQVAETAITDPKQYVETILSVFKRFNTVVTQSFHQDAGFVQAMDQAFTKFINENQITTMANSLTKSPELLARYCDLLLRKSNKNPDEVEMENLLNEIIIVFKYIEDKDVFQKFYSKKLAHRLVTDSSASDEAESNMISKLKQMCGFEYTTKLQRMFTDSGLSKEMSDKYKQERDGSGIDFSIMILASSVWPYNQTPAFEIPKSLTESIDSFTQFYNKKHNGRKLSWLLHMGKGELASNGFPKKYIFMCSVPQMSVLMQFNNTTELSYDTLANETKLELASNSPQAQTLEQVVRSLVKSELLKASTLSQNSTFAAETVLTLNTNYQNKKFRVDLAKMLMGSKETTKHEAEEVQKSVDEDRRLVIQAAIVRIMKMRKVLKHSQLMIEVIQQLSSRFHPKVQTIKNCIDMLIEKEYIKRSNNERDTYEYLA